LEQAPAYSDGVGTSSYISGLIPTESEQATTS
jgi:hypothetical protein